MKKILVLIAIGIVTLSYTQVSLSKHDVQLNGAKFVKLTYQQVIDSCNMNQTGQEQFETFDIELTTAQLAEVDKFMATCTSIDQIIGKYGAPGIDIASMSNDRNKIKPLSGFYYATQKVDKYSKRPRLTVIYPRHDRLPASYYVK